MARPKSLRIHGVRTKDWAERLTFVIVFLVGAAGIIFLKAVSTNPYLVALFAGAMIVAYMLIAMLFGRVQIEPEMVGDNCYYLGFLFTLTSLSYTLSELASTGADIDARTEMIGRVIGGFGVALSSTIVGVFLRVVLMQIRPDIVARDREMHIELHESVRELRRQLASSIVAIKQFTTESIQHAQERDARVGESLSAAAESISEKNDETVKEIIETIKSANVEAAKTAAAGLSSQIGELSENGLKQVEQALMRFAEASGKLADTQEKASVDLADRFHTIDERLGKIATRIQEAETELEKAPERLDPTKVGKAFSTLETDVSSSGDRIREASEKLERAIHDSAQRIELASTRLAEEIANRPKGRFWFSRRS